VRNELMRELIAENLHLASTGPRTAPRYAAAPKPAVSPPSTTAAIRPPHPPPGSIDPIRPMPVKTVPMGKSGEPLPPSDDKPAAMDVLPVSSFGGASLKQPLQITPFPVTTAVPAAQAANAAPAARRSAPLPLPPSLLPATPTETASAVQIAAAPQATASTDEKPAPAKGGWLIQIGAYTKESEAHARLAEARERAAAILSKVRSYSEKTVKGTTAYFRARFAGFDEASAKRACDTLKKSDFACFATKN
jgi:D-alanyl-D-alanine carboxypeptidase